MNRREFLQSIASVGTLACCVTVGGRALAHVCTCGADIALPSTPAFDTAHVYCPNCGRSLISGVFRLRDHGWLPAGAAHESGNLPLWDAAQVPFPNPTLVRATSKPRVSMSSVVV